jgi:hypothetical protein
LLPPAGEVGLPNIGGPGAGITVEGTLLEGTLVEGVDGRIEGKTGEVTLLVGGEG